MAEGQITISKLDHDGSSLLSYPGRMLYDDGYVVVVRCVFEPALVQREGLTFCQGDILIECYYRYQPFNIFAVYTPTGQLKGWYCNLLERTEFSEASIGWADLALDLVVTVDGHYTVLDEHEFEALSPTPAQREQARQALRTLISWISLRMFPFNLR
jgi:predicted RNA-binding protein associated with RNAse of E/G family